MASYTAHQQESAHAHNRAYVRCSVADYTNDAQLFIADLVDGNIAAEGTTFDGAALPFRVT